MSRRVITEAYIKKSRKVQLANRIKDSASESLLGAVIAVVVFGSIWGLVEITLGGFLYFVHFPLYKGGGNYRWHRHGTRGNLCCHLQPAFPRLLDRGTCRALQAVEALIYGQPSFHPICS